MAECIYELVSVLKYEKVHSKLLRVTDNHMINTIGFKWK